MTRVGYVIAGTILLAVLLTACGNADAEVDELALSINQTATAAAAQEVDAASALLTAEAQATALVLELEATQAAGAAQATQEAQATAAAAAPILNELPTYGVDPSEGYLEWIHPPATLDVDGFMATDYVNNYLGTLVKDFVISTDITWDTRTGLSGCGFVLRSNGDEDAFDQYLAVASRGGNGSTVFIKQEDNSFFNIQVDSIRGRDPAFSFQNGATNRLTVVGRGDTFTIFTNGVQVHQRTDAEYERGFVALVVLSESGPSHCEFNNTWLWVFNE